MFLTWSKILFPHYFCSKNTSWKCFLATHLLLYTSTKCRSKISATWLFPWRQTDTFLVHSCLWMRIFHGIQYIWLTPLAPSLHWAAAWPISTLLGNGLAICLTRFQATVCHNLEAQHTIQLPRCFNYISQLLNFTALSENKAYNTKADVFRIIHFFHGKINQ